MGLTLQFSLEMKSVKTCLQFFHTWDGINPFNGQKERFLQLSFGERDVRIHDFKQLHHCVHTKVRLSVLIWSKKMYHSVRLETSH